LSFDVPNNWIADKFGYYPSLTAAEPHSSFEFWLQAFSPKKTFTRLAKVVCGFFACCFR
jgi:hypothetical protein